MTQVTMRSGNTVSMTQFFIDPALQLGSACLNSNVLILDVLTRLITGRTGTQGLINPRNRAGQTVMFLMSGHVWETCQKWF